MTNLTDSRTPFFLDVQVGQVIFHNNLKLISSFKNEYFSRTNNVKWYQLQLRLVWGEESQVGHSIETLQAPLLVLCAEEPHTNSLTFC